MMFGTRFGEKTNKKKKVAKPSAERARGKRVERRPGCKKRKYFVFPNTVQCKRVFVTTDGLTLISQTRGVIVE
jgi:hypothetical protein